MINNLVASIQEIQILLNSHDNVIYYFMIMFLERYFRKLDTLNGYPVLQDLRGKLKRLFKLRGGLGRKKLEATKQAFWWVCSVGFLLDKWLLQKSAGKVLSYFLGVNILTNTWLSQAFVVGLDKNYFLPLEFPPLQSQDSNWTTVVRDSWEQYFTKCLVYLSWQMSSLS